MNAQNKMNELRNEATRLANLVNQHGFEMMAAEPGWRRINHSSFCKKYHGGFVGLFDTWGVEAMVEEDRITCCVKINRDGVRRTYWYRGNNLESAATIKAMLESRAA